MATASTASTASLTNVPPHLTIRVLYSDDDIVVIDKPANLRSVPGHASNSPDADDGSVMDGAGASTSANTPSSKDNPRMTAQDAWVEAIRASASSIHDVDDTADTTTNNNNSASSEPPTEEAAVKQLLHNLCDTSDLASIPRKLSTFERYCQRNRKRLLPSFPSLDCVPPTSPINAITQPPPQKKQKRGRSKQRESTISPELKRIAESVYSFLKQRHLPLMNLPKATDDTESALGQLRLLNYGEYAHSNYVPSNTSNGSSSASNAEKSKYQLHVVHRLDCQTSGIMVVARNSTAASKLCHAWRERDIVQKTY
eukprot:g589.t1 g589   contig10:347926-348947(+)